MAISKMTDEVNIISLLGDNPNTDNGLSAEELKAKFDEAAKLIKAYLNNKLVPAVAQIETDLGNATSTASYAATLADKANAAATYAAGVANKAATAADEAKASAAAAVGMQREFTSGSIAANSYTTPGILSKFYHILIDDSGTITSITVDWQAVYDFGSVALTYVTYIRTEGEYLPRSLTAKMNSDSTVTFTADIGANICHVCGYY